MRRVLISLGIGLLLAAAAPGAEEGAGRGPVDVVVIPVQQQIARPVLYVIRRGLKEAIDRGADVVVLDMHTPGGALDVTFEIMEALGRFPGRTITFVDSEAISAGAFISAVTDDIFFTPDGVIGAAAPVLATGGDIDDTMRQKIVSYLRARVRAVSEGKAYRGQVISAMIDSDYKLVVDDKVLKDEGELLSLTATEAFRTYGDPPQPLLAAGIAPDIRALLTQEYGAGRFTLTELETNWAEQVAQYLNGLSPLLLGLGLVALFIEFKTPGFGVFGASGILLLLLVFFGHYIAGFSGHEPMLVFFLGVLLVFAELFFFPGVVFVALTGFALMLGSLVWSMADLWPNEPIAFGSGVFVRPLINLGLGIVTAVAIGFGLLRFLPRGWVWDRLVLSASVGGPLTVAPAASGAPPSAEAVPLLGRSGTAVTGLYPSGQVEIDGRRFEARLAVGSAPAGTSIVVTGRTEFGLLVEAQPPA